MSYAEANLYYNISEKNENNMESRALPTAYAKPYTSEYYAKEKGKWWWLRSQSLSSSFADTVNPIGYYDDMAVRNRLCIRPVFWVNLEADIFQSETSIIFN